MNGNGYLDYGEFVAITIHLQRLSNDGHLRTAFLFFDKDGNGKLERKDVTRRMNEASHQERTPSHITAQLFSNFSCLD